MSEVNLKEQKPIAFPSRFPRGASTEDTRKRQEIIKSLTNIDLAKNEVNPPEDLKGIIENNIGYLSIPMGIAAPLLIEGSYAKGEFCVPVCTVEGTLVASMTRGMLVTAKCGGIQSVHLKQEISRAPFFIFKNVKETVSFIAWVEEHFTQIKQIAESTTHYGKLVKIDKYIINHYVVLDFIFNTGNAAGQNMISQCTMEACNFLKKKLNVEYILDSNFAGDKKASSISTLRGRGHKVICEALIDHKVLRRFLGTTVDSFKVMQEFGPYASSMAGNQGIQLHLANALTAIYLATGQDTACVAENALGYTQTKVVPEGLLFTLTMPSLTVGTVGGGTRLKPQKRNLELLGCNEGEDSSKKLAEIICASALCLEISLLSAIVTETWVNAHMKHGRQKK